VLLAMKRESANRLLDRIAIVRHPCDLDLLSFFARHGRALLTTEHLAFLVGYEAKQVAESLDVLLTAGLLTRAQSQAHAARLYVFTSSRATGLDVSELLELDSTREGRQALRAALAEKSRRTKRDPLASGGHRSASAD
jgi:hypothetical protein